MVSTAASESGANRYLIMPVRKIAGMKMARVVMVPARTGVATSSAPSRAASRLLLPRPRWRTMFSTTTMPASITVPTAKAMPPSVITLIVCPEK